MNNDFYTTVQLKDGSARAVSFSFDVDGYKPLVYGVFDAETDEDVTDSVTEESFDSVYNELCTSISDTASDSFDMER